MYIKNGSFKKYTHIISYVPPSIIQQPTNGLVKINENFEFKFIVRGSRPLEYKWFRNNFPIKNSNTNTLTISSVQSIDQAEYYCVVKNNLKEIKSNTVQLSVFSLPDIIIQPTTVNTELNSNVSFTVTVTGTPPLSYQWYKDNNIYSGDTDTLYINDVTKEDEGNYFVIISNDIGSITSQVALLSIFNTLDIYKNPTYYIANQYGSANFNLYYMGATPVTAQWLKDDNVYGSKIVNSTGRIDLNITNVSLSDAGYYSCVLSNIANSVTSIKSLLYVNASVEIITQPISATILKDLPYVFSVVVSGTSPITYKWFKNSIEIPFSNNNTYYIQNVQTSNQGIYYCVITNLVNSVTTNFVNLSVI